jgi:glycine cleavage system H protein
MTFPETLRYTKDHEWVRIEGNIAVVGITDHAQNELGDIVYIDIPNPEATLNAGDVFGTIEAVKTVADLFSPVSGKIVAVHTELNDSPDAVNTDPYNGGWIVKIELSNPAEIESMLMDSLAYRSLIGQ